MTRSNLHQIDHTCQLMIAAGLVKSQAEFSTDWLGQSASYLSSSKAKKRNVPDALIVLLCDRLEMRVQQLRWSAVMPVDGMDRQSALDRTQAALIEVKSFRAWQIAAQTTLPTSPIRIASFVQRIGQAITRR
ncbi:DUF6626 family protein [uncultured Devosia sp.]|uniref:DUF6626 family protein n=1 Tax=uncultured Devosia sp. TaxID=211434 RepID=UPI0035CC0A82